MKTKRPTTTGGSIRPVFSTVAAAPQPQKRLQRQPRPNGDADDHTDQGGRPETRSDISITWKT